MPVYHGNGMKMTTVTWDRRGLRADGEQTAWQNDGSLWYRGRWRNQRRHGDWVYWHRNGVKVRVVRYEAGLRHGWEEAWDQTGRFLHKRLWHRGRLK